MSHPGPRARSDAETAEAGADPRGGIAEAAASAVEGAVTAVPLVLAFAAGFGGLAVACRIDAFRLQAPGRRLAFVALCFSAAGVAWWFSVGNLIRANRGIQSYGNGPDGTMLMLCSISAATSVIVSAAAAPAAAAAMLAWSLVVRAALDAGARRRGRILPEDAPARIGLVAAQARLDASAPLRRRIRAPARAEAQAPAAAGLRGWASKTLGHPFRR